MSDVLKLTAHFAERERVGRAFLADVVLDLCAEHRVSTAIMLRGIGGFGPRNIVRSDELLSLSEDLPVLISAIDTPGRIEALADELAESVPRGLLTVERAQLVDRDTAAREHTVNLSLYLSRHQRVQGVPGHKVACTIFHRHGFTSATTFLGVDGLVGGIRRRARFISRNTDVPIMVTATGTAEQAVAARTELAELFDDPLLTVENVQICKQDGQLLQAPPADGSGFGKLTVLSTEDTLVDDTAAARLPIHRALVRRLHDTHQVGGATVLRGLWGFHGSHAPQGDSLWRLRRQVPVASIVVDTPEAITAAFTVADALTDGHGVVTCERVPIRRVFGAQ